MAIINDEFYTPPEEIELVREFLGWIDLDPASCEKANEIVKAKSYYTAIDDGLTMPWYGKIFCNPPYSRGMLDKFVSSFLAENLGIEDRILLTNSNTSSNWFHRALSTADAVCFCGKTNRFKSRIKFIGGDSVARSASVYFYCGRRSWAFCEHFEKRGYVIKLRG